MLPQPRAHILFMLQVDSGEMMTQVFTERLRQHRAPILLPLAVTDDNLPVLEIHVLDAQATAFHQSQTRAVEERCHQAVRARQVRGDPSDLFRSEDDRDALRAFGARDALDERQVDPQHTSR